MKIKLTEAGWLNYTGQMGVTFFEDGLSVGDVLVQDGMRIAASIGAEWEDGTPANVGQMYLNNMDSPAFVGNEGAGNGDINNISMPVETSPEKPVSPDDETPISSEDNETIIVENEMYSPEQLSAIADEKGIAGLREIGDELGVKGTSILALIDGILKAQAARV